MARKILIIQGHPHGGGGHFCHGLADAYADGAAKAGHEVRRIDVAEIGPALLSDPAEFATPPTGALREAQEAVRAADHLAIFFPLWLATMPAMLKAFLEQLARGEFLLSASKGGWPEQNLRGRSARIVVTMGMPAFFYRWVWGAAGVRCLRTGILKISGVTPVRTSYIGGVDALGDRGRADWLRRMEALGRHAR